MQIPLPTPCCAHFQTTELPCLQCGKQMNLTLENQVVLNSSCAPISASRAISMRAF
jgi:hypothetical protein